MIKKAKNLALLPVFFALGCTNGPSGQAFDSPVGTWQEKFESSSGVGGAWRSTKFTIIDESAGRYSRPPSEVRFYAVDEQGRWKGYWKMPSSDKTVFCSSEKDGTAYWGEVIYEFNGEFNQYSGSWDKCGEGQKYKISGIR